MLIPRLGIVSGTGGGGGGGPVAASYITSTTQESSHVMKNAPGTLFSVAVVTGAVSGWLMLFDLAVAPAAGAVTPLRMWRVPSDGTSGQFDESFPNPVTCSNGIVLAFSSTGPLTLTYSATALFSAQVQ
jgi:hypothetical protein